MNCYKCGSGNTFHICYYDYGEPITLHCRDCKTEQQIGYWGRSRNHVEVSTQLFKTSLPH